MNEDSSTGLLPRADHVAADELVRKLAERARAQRLRHELYRVRHDRRPAVGTGETPADPDPIAPIDPVDFSGLRTPA
jgi:hypothetical protein